MNLSKFTTIASCTLLAGALCLTATAEEQAQAEGNEAELRNALAAELLEKGQADEAIAEFRKAVELDPSFGPAQLNLAFVLDQQGQKDEAIKAYENALQANPDSAVGYNNLAVLYNDKGDYERAIKAAQQSLAIDPQNSQAKQNLANFRANQATVQQQAAQFAIAEQRVKKAPKDPKAAYDLARLYASYGKRDEALQWLRKAMTNGFNDVAFMKGDPSMKLLHQDPTFKEMVK